MSTNLLLVLPFWEDDASRAETLVDWIYQLNGRNKDGHALLVAAPGVHGEMITKIGISADLAFHSYSLIHLPPWSANGKDQGINSICLALAGIVAKTYSWPWLWLEPDSIPLKYGWLTTLALAYHGQPRRYFGSSLMLKSKEADSPDIRFLSRVAIYPHDAIEDLKALCSAPAPFNINPILIEKAATTKLFQNGRFDGDASKVRPDALIYHTDKEQALIPLLRPFVDTKPLSGPSHDPITTAQDPLSKKLDKRTKAYKEMMRHQTDVAPSV